MSDIIIYTETFVPKDDFVKFAKEFGYDSVFDPKFRVDERALWYVRAKSIKTERIDAMDGKKSTNYESSKTNCAYILSVDTSKKWRLVPKDFVFNGYLDIEYIDVTIDSNGQLTIKKA